MIEETVIQHLTEQMTPIPAFMETPADPPEKWILVEKTGTTVENYLWCSTFAVRSHGPSLYEAAALSRTVIDAMSRLPERAEVTRCRLNTEGNYTDTASKRYRYQAVFDIYHYEF